MFTRNEAAHFGSWIIHDANLCCGNIGDKLCFEVIVDGGFHKMAASRAAILSSISKEGTA